MSSTCPHSSLPQQIHHLQLHLKLMTQLTPLVQSYFLQRGYHRDVFSTEEFINEVRDAAGLLVNNGRRAWFLIGTESSGERGNDRGGEEGRKGYTDISEVPKERIEVLVGEVERKFVVKGGRLNTSKWRK